MEFTRCAMLLAMRKDQIRGPWAALVRRVIPSLILCLTALPGASQDEPSRPGPVCGPASAGKPLLGIAYPPVGNKAEIRETIAAMKDLGLSCVRIGCDWSLREPRKDRYYWDPLEERLRAFADAGISVLLTLETHAWPGWLPKKGKKRDDPQTLLEFREYVRDLLDIYGSIIFRIQVGNEWNWEIDDFFDGSEQAYIAYANILADEVRRYRNKTGAAGPTIVLGSFSARAALAYDRGLVSEIRIEGRSVYLDQVRKYAALPPAERMYARVRTVISAAEFEMLDVHFYDDYPDWALHLQAFLDTVREISGPAPVPVLVSEFGGPYPVDLYPEFGTPSPELLARRLPEYVRTLQSIGIAEAYFFRLRQGYSPIPHADSYLVDRQGGRTPAYEAMKRRVRLPPLVQ